MALARNGLRSLCKLTEAVSRPVSVSQGFSQHLGAANLIHPSLAPSTVGLQCAPGGSHNFHTCSVLQRLGEKDPENWLKYNDIVYPPQKPGDLIRPAEVFHQRCHIKYSYKKMWYLASMIRGMSVDEAIKQLSFMQRTGAKIIKEVLEEAQEEAVNKHNVEFKSNMWIADSFVGKGGVVKSVRKHARMRLGQVRYGFIHYFVALREGSPPKHYWQPELNGNQLMEQYLQERRNKRIITSL